MTILQAQPATRLIHSDRLRRRTILTGEINRGLEMKEEAAGRTQLYMTSICQVKGIDYPQQRAKYACHIRLIGTFHHIETL